jgi:Sigma-70 region 2
MRAESYPTLKHPATTGPGERGTPGPGRATTGRREGTVVSDSALMLRVADGDRAALAALYDRHARVAYSLATRLVGSATAEDVVHDAFVALVERPGSFDSARGEFRSWFLTAVHHRCINQLRLRNRTTSDDEALVSLPDSAPEPVEAVLRALQDASVGGGGGRIPQEPKRGPGVA